MRTITGVDVMTGLTKIQQRKLITLQASMKMSELYALRWIAMATTGAAGRRCVSVGNIKLTPEELIDDALVQAQNHIWKIDKISNNIALLFDGRENEMEP
jgi:hypothetical protein